MVTRPSNVAQARIAAERHFDLAVKQAQEMFAAYLGEKRQEFLQELADVMQMEKDLPGIRFEDYTSLQTVRFSSPVTKATFLAVQLADPSQLYLPKPLHIANAEVHPGKVYEGYLLLREKAQEEKKP